MNKNIAVLVLVSLLVLPAMMLQAENSLVTRVPNVSQQKPGYIKNAVIVAEPHGAYTEQSLYLEYSDNLGFSGSNTVEIIHRFELPEGAVVNDLWLWVGTDVMKGLILDTWRARSIYDSIVAMKRDPAFLTKRGNQYELKIYPLTSGQIRRIKMNIIVPTRWERGTALAELPFKFFNASGGTTLPVDIMFRVRQNAWGSPFIKEDPSSEFEFVTDTLGYSYRKYRLENLKSLTSLHISYQTSFTDGAFFSNNYVNNLGNYYQLGFIPGQMMEIDSMDRPLQKVIVGIDLSGDFGKGYSSIIPKLKSTLNSSLKPGDRYKLLIAGAGKVKQFQDEWDIYTTQHVDSLLGVFLASTFGDSVKTVERRKINFADDHTPDHWYYPGMDNLADIRYFPKLELVVPYITEAAATASYQNYTQVFISDTGLVRLRENVDSSFAHGGRYLTYFDRNRIYDEKIAKYYIPSISVEYDTSVTMTLYRAEGGNISSGFPQEFDRAGNYFFRYDDSSVVKELIDNQGRPCVISKRIGNGGLLVVTGMWQHNDDAALKALTVPAMLGVNSTYKQPQMLTEMLLRMRDNAAADSGSILMVFSNSDSLITSAGLQDWVTNYLAPLEGTGTKIRSINILDGSDVSPMRYQANGIVYYGSGYLMKTLAENTNGVHFETHSTSWTTIAGLLAPSNHPAADSISVNLVFPNPGDSLLSIRPVNNFLLNPDQPVIYMGEITANDSVSADFTIKFDGLPGVYTKRLTYGISLDTTLGIVIIPSMLGNERLKQKLYNTPWDTAGIVGEAVKFNLVSDYTALLCLEPNDTIRPLINPFDESTLLGVELTSFEVYEDSTGFMVEWMVNAEQNNKGFRIEKFVNGLGGPVAFISGRGTSLSRYTYRYLDNSDNPYAASSIRYVLYQIDNDGTERIIAEKEIIPLGMPVEYSLSQNYPNPFNPFTTIAYGVKEKGHVVLTVYDILGNKVAEIVNAVKDRGRFTAEFDGSRFSSGVYFYTLQVNGFTQTKKLTLLK